MVRNLRYLFAFVIAAFGAGASLYWVSAGQQHADPMRVEHEPQSGPGAISQERRRAFGSDEAGSSKFAVERATAESDVGANLQMDRTPPTAHLATSNLDSGASSRVAIEDMDGLSVPEGAAFPIAESIEKECASGEDLYFDCPGVQWALKRIEDEGRDTQWAPAVESRIRTAVAAVPGVRLRSLACRSTVCAVETDGAFLGANAWNPLEKDLLDAGHVRARERTGNGEETFRVQLWMFKRRR